MKHYLVFCKDDQQWVEYVTTMSDNVQHSKQYTIETRGVSFILHDNFNPDNGAVYFKITPFTVHLSVSAAYLIGAEKIWLCTKEEFV